MTAAVSVIVACNESITEAYQIASYISAGDAFSSPGRLEAGTAFLALARDAREQLASKLHSLTQERPSIAWLRNRDARWVRPALTVRVRHLAGPRLLRHATVREIAPVILCTARLLNPPKLRVGAGMRGIRGDSRRPCRADCPRSRSFKGESNSWIFFKRPVIQQTVRASLRSKAY
jgi:hypothetical protein